MISTYNLKALLFVLLALSVAAVLRPRLKDDDLSLRIIIHWVLSAVIAMMVAHLGIRFALLGGVALALTPPKVDARPAFYISALFSATSYMNWLAPFPGMNYLVVLDYEMVLNIVVLVPLLVALGMRKDQRQLPGTPFVDTLVVVIFLLMASLDSRGSDATFTNTLRNFFIEAMMFLVPYFALSRGLTSWASHRYLVISVLTTGTLLAAVGLIGMLHNWNHYLESASSNSFNLANYRGSSVRVVMTTMPSLACMNMAAAFLTYWFVRKSTSTNKLIVYGWMAISVVVIAASQSRGGFLGLMFLGGAYLVVQVKGFASRAALITAGLVSMFVAYSILQQMGFDSVDEYGTFDYRKRLLEATIAHVKEYPWIGIANFYDQPRFQELIQGQGIIDFVNSYVQYALHYGLIGLSMFLVLYARTGLGTLSAVDKMRELYPDAKLYSATGIGCILILAFMLATIFTVSRVSYVDNVLIFLVGMGAGYWRLVNYTAVHGVPANDRAHQPIGAEEDPADQKDPSPPPFEIDVRPGARGWNT